MRIVITGGHGFIGTRLARELVARGHLSGRTIERLVLADLVEPEGHPFAGMPGVRTVPGDLADTLPELFAEPVDAVFHLASAVSAECERDLDLGLRVNLDAPRAALDAARRQHAAGGPLTTLVFSSSVAVYGSVPALPLPEVVSEATLPTPQSSYGAQKFACEQLIADYTRRGHVDGRIARLMTVAVRPGRPNAAASSFVSGIIREPLAGVVAPCPVGPDVRLAIASPGRAVAGLLALAEGPVVGRLPVNLPALTVTVGEMIAALRAVGGEAAAALVRPEPDPRIEAIVASWPARFDNARAAALGLAPDPDVASIIRQYLAEHPDAVHLP
ncbi:MAG: NAD-dependent epimerase/dehydratase family protein [Austwickia sp.]|nr:MAG: NAD-dependent epimerase/dehydratase family protein [Austwickia sp.]